MMVAALLMSPSKLPLTSAERIDVLEAQARETVRAHNALADAVLALSVQLNSAMQMIAILNQGAGLITDEPALPAREPFKRHGKRH